MPSTAHSNRRKFRRNLKPRLGRAARRRLYIERQKCFDSRRRKIALNFCELYQLFASEQLSMAAISKRAHVSRPRIQTIFDLHFSDLIGATAFARREKRETQLRQAVRNEIAQRLDRDELLRAIRKSARRAAKKRTDRVHMVEHLVSNKKGASKAIRRKAVLVDGELESVHHIQSGKLSRSRRLAYGATNLYRNVLRRTSHSIFFIDVPGYVRRVLRCRNEELLAALFQPNSESVGIHIPLDHRPETSRYDFLADEDNWN
jgi:AraC-like DNA-binding protein